MDGDANIKSLIRDFSNELYDYSLLINSLKLESTKIRLEYSTKLRIGKKNSGSIEFTPNEFIGMLNYDLSQKSSTEVLSMFLKKPSKFKKFLVTMESELSIYPDLSIDFTKLSKKELRDLLGYIKSI